MASSSPIVRCPALVFGVDSIKTPWTITRQRRTVRHRAQVEVLPAQAAKLTPPQPRSGGKDPQCVKRVADRGVEEGGKLLERPDHPLGRRFAARQVVAGTLGDWAQLGAVGAGGAFSMLAADRRLSSPRPGASPRLGNAPRQRRVAGRLARGAGRLPGPRPGAEGNRRRCWPPVMGPGKPTPTPASPR